MTKGALRDIKVLDLGGHISAPYCAHLLASYGAEVVKVEEPGEGDPARKAGPFPKDQPHLEKSGLFLHLNRDKKGITLKLQTPEGAKVLKELAQQFDILVENFQPSFLSSLGLDYQDLAAINPRLVMTSITPFGRTGPYRNYKSTDLGVFAMSGRMYIHGLVEREPLRYAPDISWFQAGATASIATLAAFLVSKTQGIGQHVDISAMETLVGNVDNRPLYYAYTGVKGGRGNWPGGYPQGAYPCKDGYVIFGVGYDRFFRRLCHAMGRADLLETPEFSTPGSRAQHLETFEGIFFSWLMEHTKREIFEICQNARVLCAPLSGPDDLFDDPQLKERGFFLEIDHPLTGKLPYPGPPFNTSVPPREEPNPAPLLGQHNTQIYRDLLGYSEDKFNHLQSVGVI